MQVKQPISTRVLFQFFIKNKICILYKPPKVINFFAERHPSNDVVYLMWMWILFELGNDIFDILLHLLLIISLFHVQNDKFRLRNIIVHFWSCFHPDMPLLVSTKKKKRRSSQCEHLDLQDDDCWWMTYTLLSVLCYGREKILLAYNPFKYQFRTGPRSPMPPHVMLRTLSSLFNANLYPLKFIK